MISNRFKPHAATWITSRTQSSLSDRNTSYRSSYVVANYYSLRSSKITCTCAPPAQQLTCFHTSSAALFSASAVQTPSAKQSPPKDKTPETTLLLTSAPPPLAVLSLRSPQELPSPSRSKDTMHNVADVRRGRRGWDLRRHAGGHTVPGPSTAEKILRRVAPNTCSSQPRCCETGRRPASATM